MNSSRALSCLVFVAFLFSTSFGNKQYITIYQDQGQQGANLTLDQHYANLSELHSFLDTASSYCAVGWIAFYTNVNYNIEGGVAVMIDNDDTAPKCANRVFNNFNSFRYLGNPETNLPGVSLYSKPGYHGAEVFINENGEASGPFTHPVFSIVMTGNTSATLYDLDGIGTCFLATAKITMIPELDAIYSNVSSVSLGCGSSNIVRL